MTNVKVRAVENGHDGIQYRNAGEVFEVDAKRLKDGTTWFEKVVDDTPVDPEPEPSL